jgi:hypothetical protein
LVFARFPAEQTLTPHDDRITPTLPRLQILHIRIQQLRVEHTCSCWETCVRRTTPGHPLHRRLHPAWRSRVPSTTATRRNARRQGLSNMCAEGRADSTDRLSLRHDGKPTREGTATCWIGSRADFVDPALLLSSAKLQGTVC